MPVKNGSISLCLTLFSPLTILGASAVQSSSLPPRALRSKVKRAETGKVMTLIRGWLWLELGFCSQTGCHPLLQESK